MKIYEAIIIGGGQSALATAYFLKREKIDFLILDSNDLPGGSWTHTWSSLKLFSPKEYSSLPGWMMPPTQEPYPSRSEIINYLTEYEKRYEFAVKRPVEVKSVTQADSIFTIKTDQGDFFSKTVVSATGNWSGPFIPRYKGLESFPGEQIHSAHYHDPAHFHGKTVMIVGGGNSGAQILAEVSKVAKTIWVTKEPPEFLPDDVDGRYLFNLATKKYQAMLKGENIEEAHNLAKIVMVESVKDARARDVLHARGPFSEIKGKAVLWADGSEEKVETKESHSIKCPNLWLVGYGDWTGFASATLIGVQRVAKQTAAEINKYLLNE